MRILVACDDSEGAAAALEAAHTLAAHIPGSSLRLLHVVNPLIDAAEVFATTRSEAVSVIVQNERTRLVGAINDLDPSTPADADVVELEHGETTSDAIIRVAAEWGADMIALASRRVETLSGAFLGSVAGAVARDSQIPVLIVQPRRAAQ